jgi:HEPN domain-containing protein
MKSYLKRAAPIEKALKALLTANQVSFPRTHDLLRVLDLTLVLMPDLDSYREQFADMETYAVDIRYPDLGFDPSREEALEALALSQEIVGKVRAAMAMP